MRTVQRALSLALILALPAGAQMRGGKVVPLPPSAGLAPVHQALLSPDAPGGGPLAGLLAMGASRIAAAVHAPAPGPAPAAAVLQAMAQGEPAERAAASVLARALSDTRETAALLMRVPALADSDLPSLAARRTPLGEAVALAESARLDPAVSFLFDGRAAREVETPAGADLEGEDLLWKGQRVSSLGRGFFGVVHPHPSVEGAVVKTDLPRKLSVLGEPADMGPRRIEKDRAVSLAAARIGAGPRVLGMGTVAGHAAIVKERVYGDTVERRLEDDAFDEEDHGLLEDLFLRIARSGLSFVDVRPGNVMIGRTLVDPVRRAYLVDGGESFTPRQPGTVIDGMEKLFGVLRQLTFQDVLLKRFDKVHFSRPVPPEP
ncbi:MAG: hypothetical protein Q8T11_07435 [Elusimicrobiota bacterium]|nr:hypothetical protein [Elusimicrobiota bacterium]